MKFAILLLPVVLLGSCAPQAILLIDGATAGSKPQSVAVEDSGRTPSPSANGAVPNKKPGGIGLLDPSGLTTLPNEQAIRPTVSTEEDGPVIATPPGANE